MASFNTPRFLLIVLISIIAAVSSAKPPAPVYIYSSSPPPPPVYYYSSPPPPVNPGGNGFCTDPSTKCYGAKIVCPSECPVMKPANPDAKECTVNCNSAKCEASCKKQKPDCQGKGSACGDPRFVGGDGIVFFFHGKSNQHFTLVSDQNLQINAHFIGRRPNGRTRDYTWIQALGLLFNDHSFTLSANKVAEWNNDIDQISFTYDNMPINVTEGHLSSWTANDESGMVVERRSRVNTVIVTLPGIIEISASVVPVTKEDDRIHNYQIPNDDCFAHLEVQFRFFDLTDNIEGVLGQTYRPNFKNPVKRGVPMPIMGGERKYATSSLTSVGCASCIFSPLPKPEESLSSSDLSLEPTISSMDCSMGNGRGVACRR